MNLIDGFYALFTEWQTVFFVVLGTIIGLIAGAIPGLTSSGILALMVPLTFFMSPLSGLAFIYTISKSADFGGSIPAILFNTPGTPQAAATQQDGYPLTRQGKQGKAMRMAVIASASGDIFSECLLIFGAGALAVYAMKMGPAEFTAVYACAFLITGSVIGDSLVKGMMSTLMGIFLSLVGLDSITAEETFTFGSLNLLEGIQLVPLALGLFVISEVLLNVTDRSGLNSKSSANRQSSKPEDNRVTWLEYKKCFPVMIRSTGLGALIGILPGVGATIASFAAYGVARRTYKSDRWGKGEIAGVAASEAANNATSGANLIPLLTLGIPGSSSAAILAGVMLLHGITIGPTVFVTSHHLIYGLFAAGIISIFTYFVVGYYGSVWIGRMVARIPVQIVYPFILVTCFIATYTARQSTFDLYVMCVFGVVGYLMKRFGFSVPAFIIAFILGSGAERSLRQTLLMDESGIWIVLDRPIALFVFAIGLTVLSVRVWGAVKKTTAIHE